MIKGVIFDMDGVLIDSESFYFNRRNRFLIENEMADRAGQDFTGSNEQAMWEALVPDNLVLQNEMREKYKNYRKTHPIDLKIAIDPEVPSVFKKLKENNLKIAIASSSPKSEIENLIVEAKLENFLDFYISGAECAHHKPDPEIYLRALKGLRIQPEEAIAVEDSEPGIDAAKNAHITALARSPITFIHPIDQSKADGKISSLSEIIDYLNSL